MTEISYKTYCQFGALGNPQLTKRDLYGKNGRFIKTRYYAYDGELYYRNVFA